MSDASATTPLTGTYTLDTAHSRIGFAARHAMVTKIRGSFNEFGGSGYFDADDPSKTQLQLTIASASVDTRNADRDGHLKGDDFLNVEKFPQITFVSTSVERVNDEDYRVTGDLTVRDVTRPVTVDFEFGGAATDPFGNSRIGFDGKTTINRKDWGVSWNAVLEAGGLLVSEKVTLEFEVSAIKSDES